MTIWEDQIRCILKSHFPKDITEKILNLYMEEYRKTYVKTILEDFPEEIGEKVLEGLMFK